MKNDGVRRILSIYFKKRSHYLEYRTIAFRSNINKVKI